MPRHRRVHVGTIFGEGPPPKIWEGKKRLKFSAISDNFRVLSRISPEQIHISKIGKKTCSTTTPPTLGEKKNVNFGPQTKKLYTCMLTHPKAGRTHVSCPTSSRYIYRPICLPNIGGRMHVSYPTSSRYIHRPICLPNIGGRTHVSCPPSTRYIHRPLSPTLVCVLM